MLFKLKKLDKTGSAVYSAEGTRGSIYVSKGLLVGDAPQELDIPYDGFTPPGSARAAAAPKNPTPEQIEKAKANVAKAEATLARAKERAEKAAARAAKYTQPAEEPVPA